MTRSLVCLTALFLSGCGTYSTHFDCPVGEGVRCASLSTINKKMDKQEIQIDEDVGSQKNQELFPYLTPEFADQLEA